MVEQGRLQATKFSPLAPPDMAFKEWTTNIAKLDGVIPPPSIYIRPSTESPPFSFTHRKLRDPTTTAWLSPADALMVIHLLLQERSGTGIGVSGQHTVHLSKRVEIPREVCQVNIPGLEGRGEIEEYGHSELEALVTACFSACQLLQMNGMLEPGHFPAVSPFVPLPRAVGPQQSKKASNGVCIHPRRSPPFWYLSTETLGGQWYPTSIFISGSGDFGLLAILTRHPLPAIPDFRLFISGNPTNVRLRKCQPGRFSSNELEQLRRVTLRILRFIGNKPFVGDLNHLPYLLFPLQPDAALLNSPHDPPHQASEGPPRLGSPCQSEFVTSMAASAFLPIMTDTTDEVTRDLYDAVIQDRKIEYTKRYFVGKIREDLTPLHKPREGEVSVSRSSFHPRLSLDSVSTDTKVISNIVRSASRTSKASRTPTSHWWKWKSPPVL